MLEKLFNFGLLMFPSIVSAYKHSCIIQLQHQELQSFFVCETLKVRNQELINLILMRFGEV